jgi:hypothetical protein
LLLETHPEAAAQAQESSGSPIGILEAPAFILAGLG